MATKPDMASGKNHTPIFRPKKYKKRAGVKDSGKEFEYKMCALYALRLTLNENIYDFEMTTNNDNYGDLDDISLDIQYSSGKKEIYLLQLKHKEDIKKKISPTNLTSINQDFSLLKYINSFEEHNFQNCTCILYTNCRSTIENNQKFKIPLQQTNQYKQKPDKLQSQLVKCEPQYLAFVVNTNELSVDTDVTISLQRQKEEKTCLQKHQKQQKKKSQQADIIQFIIDKDKLPDDEQLIINVKKAPSKNMEESFETKAELFSDNKVIVCVKEEVQNSVEIIQNASKMISQEKYLNVTVREGRLGPDKLEIITTKQQTERQIKVGNNFQFEISGDQYQFEKLEEFSKNFYLLVGQENVVEVEQNIEQILLDKFDQNIYKSFIHFMNNWWSKNVVLTKRDVVSKLGELLLSPWTKIFPYSKQTSKCEVIKKVILEFEMTIIQNSDHEMIENIWDVARENSEDFERAANFFMGRIQLTPKETAQVLWHLDKVPLIVEMNNSNKSQIKLAVALLEQDKCSTKKKNIMLSGVVDRSDFPNWDIFDKLSDISNKRIFSTTTDQFFATKLKKKAKTVDTSSNYI